MAWEFLLISIQSLDSPGGSVVKNLPASTEGAVDVHLSLGWEDPLEEEMAIHS